MGVRGRCGVLVGPKEWVWASLGTARPAPPSRTRQLAEHCVVGGVDGHRPQPLEARVRERVLHDKRIELVAPRLCRRAGARGRGHGMGGRKLGRQAKGGAAAAALAPPLTPLKPAAPLCPPPLHPPELFMSVNVAAGPTLPGALPHPSPPPQPPSPPTRALHEREHGGGHALQPRAARVVVDDRNHAARPQHAARLGDERADGGLGALVGDVLPGLGATGGGAAVGRVLVRGPWGGRVEGQAHRPRRRARWRVRGMSSRCLRAPAPRAPPLAGRPAHLQRDHVKGARRLVRRLAQAMLKADGAAVGQRVPPVRGAGRGGARRGGACAMVGGCGPARHAPSGSGGCR
jgi:hypothetical protein